MLKVVGSAIAVAFVGMVTLYGCGSSSHNDNGPGPSDDGGAPVDGSVAPLDSTTPLDGNWFDFDGSGDAPDAGCVVVTGASCLVTICSPPDQGRTHVPIGSSPTWDSNPPSSGPHYPVWAAFQEYTTPVPRGYYLHNEEHGGVALLYKCDPSVGCPDIVNGLRAAEATLPRDPLCDVEGGATHRVLITPDPLLDTQVAASAWDWTYTAACIDLPSLSQFVNDHYGHGPDHNCTQGQSTF